MYLQSLQSRILSLHLSRSNALPTLAMPAPKKATKKGKGSKNEGSEPGYRRKCIELAKRINDINSYNETLVKHIERSKRGMQRLRIERAFLLEQIEKTATAMSKKPKQKNKV